MNLLKPTLVATVIAGTIDILWAMVLTLWFGREIGGMLRYVGSGPFPAATDMGTAGAILGLLVHFALIAVMAAVFMLAAQQRPALTARPILWGTLYGLATYVVMNLIVVPVRFGTPLPPSLLSIATQLFAHIVLVGIPIALVAARYLRTRPA